MTVDIKQVEKEAREYEDRGCLNSVYILYREIYKVQPEDGIHRVICSEVPERLKKGNPPVPKGRMYSREFI